MNVNERTIELSRVCGAIKEEDYRKIDEYILKKIYTTRIDFRKLMNSMLSINGLGLARFGRVCEFIIDNECEECIGEFYNIFDTIGMSDYSSSYARFAYRELMRNLKKNRNNIKKVLDFHKILFITDNDMIKFNSEMLRFKGYKEKDIDTIICPYFSIVTDKGSIERIKYSIVKNEDSKTIAHVVTKCNTDLNIEAREKNVAKDIISKLRNEEVAIKSIICYDGIYLRDELERYYGIKG